MEEYIAKEGGCPPECRRAFRRIILEEVAELSVSGKREKAVIVKDISGRGIGIESDFPVQVGGLYTLIFRSAMLQNQIFKFLRVVWCDKTDENIWRAGFVLEVSEGIQWK